MQMTDKSESFECTLPHGKFTIRKHGRFCATTCQHLSHRLGGFGSCLLFGTGNEVLLDVSEGKEERSHECLEAELTMLDRKPNGDAPSASTTKHITVLYVMPFLYHDKPYLRVSTNAGVALVPATDALECGRAALDKALANGQCGYYDDK